MTFPSLKLPGGVDGKFLVPLILLLTAALIWLLFFEADREEDRGSAAGWRVVTVPPDSLHGIQVVTGEMTTELTRSVTGWDLKGRNPGGPWQDRASEQQADALVQAITVAMASPVLAGTDTASADPMTAWQPYGVQTAQATRVTLTTLGSESIELWLGTHNPVTDLIYARGAGRQGVFTLSVDPWVAVHQLDQTVRLWRLWPEFASEEVRSVRIMRTGSRHQEHFVKDQDGSWWARLPTDSDVRLGSVAQAYQIHFNDRSRQEGDTTLWLVHSRKMEYLVSLLQQCQVKEAGPLPAAPDAMHAAGLTPPTVTVSVTLEGATSLTAAFGSEREDQLVAVARDGRDHILWVAGEVRELLLAPLAEYLQTNVLTLSWAMVDSFSLEQTTTRPFIAVQRNGSWQVRVPKDVRNFDQARLNDLCGDLVHHLDRLPIQAVMPPAPGGLTWRDDQLTRLTVAITGEDNGDLVVEFGILGQSGEAAAYFPRDGKLLLIPNDLLVTFRAIFTTLRL